MPRNITVYISDELDQKMKEFGEVNWSEIARQGIERYMDKRVVEVAIKNKVPDNIINEFRFYLESLGEFMKTGYSHSIANMHNSFNIGVTQREKTQYFEIFNHLVEDYSELCKSFELFEHRKDIKEFKPVFLKLMRIFDKYSTMVRDFALLVKEKTDKIELIGESPRSRAPNEYLDETYANFREKYNNFIMNFVKFVFLTRNLHQQNISDHRVYQLLAPRLVDFRLSAERKEEVLGV